MNAGVVGPYRRLAAASVAIPHGWLLVAALAVDQSRESSFRIFSCRRRAPFTLLLSKRLADGTLAKHAFVTLEEMLYGLLLGVGIGLAVGYAIAKLPLLENILVADHRRLSVDADRGLRAAAGHLVWIGHRPAKL